MSSNPPSLEQLAADVADLKAWRASFDTAAPSLAFFTPRPGWHRPTDAERASFAARYGVAASIDGVQVQIERLADGDIAGAFARAAFGFEPTGLRGVWDANGLAVSRAYCDRIYDAHVSDAQREDMLRGAASMDRDGEALCVMTGARTFPGLGGSGVVGTGGATTAAEVVAAFLARTAPPVAPHVEGV